MVLKMLPYSVYGSDGTDGPTDAAGGYADADTAENSGKKGINILMF